MSLQRVRTGRALPRGKAWSAFMAGKAYSCRAEFMRCARRNKDLGLSYAYYVKYARGYHHEYLSYAREVQS